jgi:hypothetical protein
VLHRYLAPSPPGVLRCCHLCFCSSRLLPAHASRGNLKHVTPISDLVFHLKNNFLNQGCGSGLIQYGSGSGIFAQSGSGSGSGSKLNQNFRRQFLSQIFLKSKFESNQIKNTGVIHQIFFQKVVLFYTFLVDKLKNKNKKCIFH